MTNIDFSRVDEPPGISLYAESPQYHFCHNFIPAEAKANLSDITTYWHVCITGSSRAEHRSRRCPSPGTWDGRYRVCVLGAISSATPHAHPGQPLFELCGESR